MDPFSNYFALLTFFTGILFLVQFIIFKFFPPANKRWYNEIVVKKEWRDNIAIWREAQRFLIIPYFILGVFYIVAAILSIFFSAPAIFSFEVAIKIIAISILIVVPIRNEYLEKRFDEDGNPRSTLNS